MIEKLIRGTMCLGPIFVGIVIGFGVVVLSIYGAEFEIHTEILWRCWETKRMFFFTFAASTVSTCETRAFKQMQKIGDSQQLWVCVGAGVRDGEMWEHVVIVFH